MSRIRQAYTSLSATSPRSQLSDTLNSIINAGPFTIDDASRKELIELIIADLASLAKLPNSSGKSRLTAKDVSQALLAVKTMGKNIGGSEVIATPDNLSTLLALSTTFKDDLDASNEALRCIANAMLLVDSARAAFVRKSVNGGKAAVELLDKSTSPERIFLASRILFLCTVSIHSASEFIQSLVEGKVASNSPRVAEIISTKLDLLLSKLLVSEKMAREAITDLLKMAFNLLLHYPKLVDNSTTNEETKVMGDCWSDKLDSMLPPLLRLFNSLPPTFPSPLTAPLTHVIHALIVIPVNPSLHPIWFPPTSPPNPSKPPSPSSSPKSASPTPASQPTVVVASSGSNSPVKESKPGAFDRAFARLSSGRSSLSRSSSPNPLSHSHDTLQRAHDLLDVSFTHYLPGNIDPDEPSVRQSCREENDAQLDDIVCPLVILLTKLCSADESARNRMRQWIIPDDLDRTSPLEGRADLLGRCLRLLACVHHPRLKDSVGEMLFAICDSDPSTLASYVGYGNVAGFLFNKGILSAPPRPATGPSTTPSGVPIDPITGVAQVEKPLIEMTDEEKEQEAEKLFVLFDRLERSGALPPEQNPIRKAAREGRLG
ncbi:guanine nucleotide exchange factor [Abortiporus biennis]|nr:guanine nucleotide exchange factor [Abortiporus biennis]